MERPRTGLWAAAIAGAALTAPAGWLVTDRLEQDDDFCNACHLAPDQPLHLDLRRDFQRSPAASLAAAHAVGGSERHADGAFRCIDCHGGVSLLGRTRVKALAAKDAFWYVVGHFEEPSGMRWPLWDEDCSQCHESFDESDPEPWENPRFHQLGVHNVELGVACVECHSSHQPEGDPRHHFLRAAEVRAQCARCHAEFEEGGV
ncbi:MAG: hypothetical protein ACR2P8_15225 [Myxococcota bacterium]